MDSIGSVVAVAVMVTLLTNTLAHFADPFAANISARVRLYAEKRLRVGDTLYIPSLGYDVRIIRFGWQSAIAGPH